MRTHGYWDMKKSKKRKGSVDRTESFDDSLGNQGLPKAGEDTAMKEMVFSGIVDAYRSQIASERFNGIKLQELNLSLGDSQLKGAIIALVEERKIDVLCSDTQLNPHIRRHPAPNVKTQVEKLNVAEKYHTCLYPTSSTIDQSYDLSFLSSKPFTREIASGHHQLKPIFFEIGVLDRYRLDPRYDFHFTEYAGRFSILSPNEKTGPIPDRDQTSIQTFGLGIDEDENPVVCVFLRYLDQLSAEHQQHWQTFLSHRPALMHVNYYKPSYLGEIYENNSGVAALRLAVNSINAICNQVWGSQLFRMPVPDEVHYNLSSFMRPSKADYFSFVHELDKLLSENINEEFFDGRVERYSTERHSDGTIERRRKGTLTLLEEWLFSGEINWHGAADKARQEIISPLRRIRRERQEPAHTIVRNEFDLKYTAQRREILRDAAHSLGNILHVLLTHPRSPQIRLPKWFEDARIEII